MVEGLDLLQGLQQTTGEKVDPQHTGRVHAQLQAVQLGVQAGSGNWKEQGEWLLVSYNFENTTDTLL